MGSHTGMGWHIDREEVSALLGRLSEAKAPSGFEDEVVQIVREFCSGWATVEVDSLLNVTITPANATGTRPVLLLDAHGDEVGTMVRAIKDNGAMSFVELGRFTKGTMGGQDVYVRMADGSWVRGVMGVRPPHFTPAGQEGASEVLLDIGATSKRDAIERFGAGIGEPVVPATHYSYDAARDVAVGKAFDCRAGITAMLLALRELSRRDDLAFDVVGCVSAQEEVGERGIEEVARRVRPRLAFAFEGCPADDTFVPADEVQTALGRGPMFRYFDVSIITNPRYQRFVLSVAAEQGIDCQTSVRAGGGNNGGPLQMHGVPCVVAGVPCRYIHAGAAICMLSDIEAAARIAVATAGALTEEHARGF